MATTARRQRASTSSAALTAVLTDAPATRAVIREELEAMVQAVILPLAEIETRSHGANAEVGLARFLQYRTTPIAVPPLGHWVRSAGATGSRGLWHLSRGVIERTVDGHAYGWYHVPVLCSRRNTLYGRSSIASDGRAADEPEVSAERPIDGLCPRCVAKATTLTPDPKPSTFAAAAGSTVEQEWLTPALAKRRARTEEALEGRVRAMLRDTSGITPASELREALVELAAGLSRPYESDDLRPSDDEWLMHASYDAAMAAFRQLRPIVVRELAVRLADAPGTLVSDPLSGQLRRDMGLEAPA